MLLFLYKMFTFIMCLIWLMFGILFLRLSISLGCVCSQPFIWTNIMHWASFLLYIRFTIKLRIINRNVSGFAMVLLKVFGAADEPLASLASCKAWWSAFRFRYSKCHLLWKFGTAGRIFLLIFGLSSCFENCPSLACYFSSHYLSLDSFLWDWTTT